VDTISLLIQILGATSIVLVLPLVYLFFNIYRLQRNVILLGLPLGFFFLAMSYIFLGLHLLNSPVIINTFSSSLMWLRVVTQTWGYTLIASSYFLAGRSQNAPKHRFLAIALWSIIAVICAFGLLMIINPTGISTVYNVNTIFASANIALLTYIIFFIIRKLEVANGSISGLISAPVAFAFLWLGQFSFLIWKLDGNSGDAAIVGSQIAPLIGLALFIRIYYLTSKRCHQTIDGEQTEQS
jgi:hypothetical protein